MNRITKSFLMAVFAASFLSSCGEGRKAETRPIKDRILYSSTQNVKSGTASAKTHKVLKGEFLNAIADRYGVEREALILANAKMLIGRFEDTCLKMQKKAGKSKSLFCNEDYKRAWANTLLPGWVIQIPDSANASEDLTKTFGPEKVKVLSAAVTSLADGDSLGLLLDVSGSMDTRRQDVAQYVMATLKASNKKFAGLYVYSENVKSIKDAINDSELRNALTKGYGLEDIGSQSIENTHKALRFVFADSKATHVLVISDEVGDDWDWSTVKDMKNVIAVCVAPTTSGQSCRSSFLRVAKEVPGSKYIPL